MFHSLGGVLAEQVCAKASSLSLTLSAQVMWLKLSSSSQENAPVGGEVSLYVITDHPGGCTTPTWFSWYQVLPPDDFSPQVMLLTFLVLRGNEAGREEAKPAHPLPCALGCPAAPMPRPPQPFSGTGTPAGKASSPQPPNPSRDTDFGRLFLRQRSLASRSPCCLSQGIAHHSNLTHRTISVSRCFSRQR